jgi:putative oxidoreductase
MSDVICLIRRNLMVLIFLISGYGKLGAGYAPTQAYMKAAGVEPALLPLVIAFELGAAIAIGVGLFTRAWALAVAAFCVASAVLFHSAISNPLELNNLLKNVSMAGGFLVLAQAGAGRLSMDSRLRRLREREFSHQS